MNAPNPILTQPEISIVGLIYDAVIQQRLSPGTKLSEADLCQAFNLGRMHARRILLSLSNQSVVDLIPNRGAFIAKPTPKQARDIFEARYALEATIASLATERATTSQIRSLELHLREEQKAHQNGNRQEAIKLSGQFHIKLAEIADNEVIEQLVKNLIVRSSLIIGMFGQDSSKTCLDDDHASITKALKNKDRARVKELIQQHLKHIFEGLILEENTKKQEDPISVLKSLL
ncbi:MAG: GntR family transcriptional regulator [bacterium]|jgi:DNA-binding GntR family transcriptional regulator